MGGDVWFGRTAAGLHNRDVRTTISTMDDEDVKVSQTFAQSCGTIQSQTAGNLTCGPRLHCTALHHTALHHTARHLHVSHQVRSFGTIAPPLTLCIMYCAFDWLLRSPSRMAAVCVSNKLSKSPCPQCVVFGRSATSQLYVVR